MTSPTERRAKEEQIALLRNAIRLTREYVGEPMLPAVEGWSWFDAIVATGGLDGFGGCGCALDPHVFGLTPSRGLRYCGLPAGHRGDHAPAPDAATSLAGAPGTFNEAEGDRSE